MRYLRSNWGVPFVLAFVLLLVLSALAAVSIGASSALSTDTAEYAFCSLLVGIALQIASYLKRGQVERATGSSGVVQPVVMGEGARRAWKVAGVLVMVILAASIGAIAYEYEATQGFHAPLMVSTGNVHEIPETGGTTVVAFSILVEGSVAPYLFQARWGDGISQNSTTGAFSRVFAAGTAPGYATATVTGGDGQKKSITVQFPEPPTGTVSSNSSTTSSTSPMRSSSTSSSSSSQTSASMTVTLGYLRSINGSGRTVTVLFGVDVHGGTTPYNFVAKWGDGVVQTSTQGTFTRTFTRTFTNATIPDTVYVTVISGDGQTTAVNVTIPAAY